MKNKKLFIVIFIAVVFLLVGAISVVAYSTNVEFERFIDENVLSIIKASKWKYVPDFSDYEDDFGRVVDFLEEIGYNDGEVFLIDYNNETQKGEIVRLDDGKAVEKYDCDEMLSESLRKITREAFKHKDAHLETASIKDGCVVFTITIGEYALVYSPDKTPSPDLLKCSDWEGKTVEVKKINDSWYHLIKYINVPSDEG